MTLKCVDAVCAREFLATFHAPFNMANAAPSTKESATDEKAGDVWAEVASSEPSELMSVYLSYDDETRHRIERQLRRKIDTRILPLVVLIYLFNFMDRNSISQARLYGLAEDTHLKGAEYQTAISIFSAGYILMQIPSTIMMTKLRPSIFLVRQCSASIMAGKELTLQSHRVSWYGP